MKNVSIGVLVVALLFSLFLFKKESENRALLEENEQILVQQISEMEESQTFNQKLISSLSGFFFENPANAIYAIDSLIVETENEENLVELRAKMVEFYEGVMDELNRKDFLSGRINEFASILSEREDSVRSVISELELVKSQLDEITSNSLAEVDRLRADLAKAKEENTKAEARKVLRLKTSGNNDILYFGEVRDGKAYGYGIGLWTNGSTYEGYWKDNKREGTGTHEWKDGEKFEGSYVNDKRHGFGIYTWTNDEKYLGNWENDLRHGKGVIYNKKGDVVTGGIWEKDKLKKSQKPEEVLKDLNKNGTSK
jgi:hypothetical protein